MTVEMEKAPFRVPYVQKPIWTLKGFYIFHHTAIPIGPFHPT